MFRFDRNRTFHLFAYVFDVDIEVIGGFRYQFNALTALALLGRKKCSIYKISWVFFAKKEEKKIYKIDARRPMHRHRLSNSNRC